ncbi:1-deoxy-D-xylulose-5-phosphate reductoisomerase [uncultured Jatrophihabitans sp.]|uniref:1-deoxy-D-xylulose-5-phosphate reductoisomerase n=1 Tax=uncultured Jatrophihabitans sp. TaxID=1610747 RepID=UPI0035CA0F69
MTREIVLLGSTGSIGTQTVDVVTAAAPDRFRVRAIAAGGSNVQLLAEQAARLRVREVGIAQESGVDELRKHLEALWPADAPAPTIQAGPQATVELAGAGCDTVLNAVDGSQGLRATIAALEAGTTVALANKESLIAGGPIVSRLAAPGQIVPVDSEHSALAQCLRSGSADEVARLLVTASGGPFRGRDRGELVDVTPQQALAHPTWDMGRLVTTNSATLVNKGLEIIEAHLLFGVPYERIEAVVHPQSVIHSMVEFVDGSTIAQASPPDMRLPISLALGWPDRVAGAAHHVDWTQAHTWTFEPLDDAAFPAVALAKRVGREGGCAPAVYNAANEQLVDAFHDGRIGFLQIVDTIADVVEEWLSERRHVAANQGIPGTVEEVEQAEDWARERARTLAG